MLQPLENRILFSAAPLAAGTPVAGGGAAFGVIADLRNNHGHDLITADQDGLRVNGLLISTVATDFVTSADFNLDGKADLASVQFSNNLIQIWNGNGNGSFVAPTSISVANGPRAVVIGDFNGDGRPDLAISRSYSTGLTVLLGMAGGGAGFTSSTLATTRVCSDLTVGDFNFDGKIDLASANYFDDSVTIFAGDGLGGFSQLGTPVSTGAGYGPCSICTLSGGKWAVADYLSGACTLSNGQTFSSITGATFVAAMDFNLDGLQDLLIGGRGTIVPAHAIANGSLVRDTAIAAAIGLRSLVIGRLGAGAVPGVLEMSQDPSYLTLNCTTVPIAGDANLDGRVDATDLLALSSHYGQTGQWWPTGDFNGDARVDSADLMILSAHWQQVTAPPTSAEPASLLIRRAPTRAVLLIQ